MKELSEINTSVKSEAIYPIHFKLRMPKRWKIAERTNIGETMRIQNCVTEHYYKQILLKAKEFFAGTIAFEKDYREVNSENALAMHSFLTPCFYWYLECTLTFQYKVCYDFYNCPFEAELTAMIERSFAIIGAANRVSLKPNCAAYFKSVQQRQEQHHFYLLKA